MGSCPDTDIDPRSNLKMMHQCDIGKTYMYLIMTSTEFTCNYTCNTMKRRSKQSNC